jgi:drug/metabolite transporter (DMT)-like permease
MKAATDLHIELLLLALLALLWGSSYLFIKIAVAEIPPVTLIAARVLGAALFLYVVLWLRRDGLPRERRTWGLLGVQAVFNSIGAWTVLAWGQQFVDAGLASVLNSTSPIFVVIFTGLLTRHEVLGGRKLLGACIGIVGVVLIVGTDALRGLGDQVIGQLACLAGAALYAGAAIYGKRFGDISATATAAGTMTWAMAVLVPAALVLEKPWTLSPGTRELMAALVLSIPCTGVALLIYFRLVRTLGSLGVASQSYLRAGIGVILGVVLLDETLSASVFTGLATAILGVALINWPVRKVQLALR